MLLPPSHQQRSKAKSQTSANSYKILFSGITSVTPDLISFIFSKRTKAERFCRVCVSFSSLQAVKRNFLYPILSYYFANITRSCSRFREAGVTFRKPGQDDKTVLAEDKSSHMGVGSNAQTHLPQQMVS